MSQRICSISQCESPHYGRGFCQMHYQRWRKHGDASYEPKARDRSRSCVVEGCDRVDDGRGCGLGMCGLHYQRFKRHGDPNHRRERVVDVAPCGVTGCGGIVKAQGVCAKHLHRLYRHGDPEARVRAEVVGERRICPTCKEDVPLTDWARRRNGKLIKCRPCHLEEYRERNQRRRALMMGRTAERFTRLEVMERDGWVCGICSEPIDRDAPWPEPLSPSLDHIIPLARGGDHTRANCQASHFLCNVRKHANVPEDVT